MSKKKSDIVISFADAESSQEVTGSCVHVNYEKTNILLECGLIQGGSVLDNYKKNKEWFKNSNEK